MHLSAGIKMDFIRFIYASSYFKSLEPCIFIAACQPPFLIIERPMAANTVQLFDRCV